MKTFRNLLFAAAVAGAVQAASAVNYSSTDLLLVFRQDNQKDVLFDIGSVSNYLSLATGTTLPVAYNLNAVKTNFNNTLAGVRFGVVGTTSQVDPLPRMWLTDANVSAAAADVTFSKFSLLTAKIDNVGVNAAIYTASNAAPYIAPVSAPSSYDYIVTYGSFSAVTTLAGDAPLAVGGFSPLPVDALYPTTISLYEVQVSTANPKPAAVLAGTFTIDVNGNLYFTAKVLPPLNPARIVAMDQDPLNGAATVSFSTAAGLNYKLLYSTGLEGGWSLVPGAGVANGDGSVQSLVDYNATDPVRFYRLQTTY